MIYDISRNPGSFFLRIIAVDAGKTSSSISWSALLCDFVESDMIITNIAGFKPIFFKLVYKSFLINHFVLGVNLRALSFHDWLPGVLNCNFFGCSAFLKVNTKFLVLLCLSIRPWDFDGKLLHHLQEVNNFFFFDEFSLLGVDQRPNSITRISGSLNMLAEEESNNESFVRFIS